MMKIQLNKLMATQFPQLATKVCNLGADDIPDEIKKINIKSAQVKLKTMQVLLQLLSNEIKKYLEKALKQAWPFLPSTINPDMMSENNKFIPKLSQADILLLSLNFAIESEEFNHASTIAFVVDRFMYWYGGSGVLLCILDHILSISPSTPVAPQLDIRRARIMKDNGDLHGAIQVLNNLINQQFDEFPSHAGQWQYNTEHQYINVCAVCVQIKGQIYHNLGLWKEAVLLLMKSVEEFEKLPKKDLKGISYSYGLLSRCLCKLSQKEYLDLQTQYVFQSNHTCYEAYLFGLSAVESSPMQSLFRTRQMLQAAECLLMYAVQLGDMVQQRDMLRVVLAHLQTVIFNSSSEELSKSKEQLIIFIKALFVITLVLGCSPAFIDRVFGDYLETACLYMYQRFSELGSSGLDSQKGNQILNDILPAVTIILDTLRHSPLRKQNSLISILNNSTSFIPTPSVQGLTVSSNDSNIDCYSDNNFDQGIEVQHNKDKFVLTTIELQNSAKSDVGKVTNKAIGQQKVTEKLTGIKIVDCDAVTQERMQIPNVAEKNLNTEDSEINVLQNLEEEVTSSIDSGYNSYEISHLILRNASGVKCDNISNELNDEKCDTQVKVKENTKQNHLVHKLRNVGLPSSPLSKDLLNNDLLDFAKFNIDYSEQKEGIAKFDEVDEIQESVVNKSALKAVSAKRIFEKHKAQTEEAREQECVHPSILAPLTDAHHQHPSILAPLTDAHHQHPSILAPLTDSHHQHPYILAPLTDAHHQHPSILAPVTDAHHQHPSVLAPLTDAHHQHPSILAPLTDAHHQHPSILAPVTDAHHQHPSILAPLTDAHHQHPSILAPLTDAHHQHPSILAPLTDSHHQHPYILAPLTDAHHQHPSILAPVTDAHHQHPSVLAPLSDADHQHPSILAPLTDAHHQHPSVLAPLTDAHHQHPSILAPLTDSHHQHPSILAPLTDAHHQHPSILAPLTDAHHQHPSILAPLTDAHHQHPSILAPLTDAHHQHPSVLAPLTDAHHQHPSILAPLTDAHHQHPSILAPLTDAHHQHPSILAPLTDAHHQHPYIVAPVTDAHQQQYSNILANLQSTNAKSEPQIYEPNPNCPTFHWSDLINAEQEEDQIKAVNTIQSKS